MMRFVITHRHRDGTTRLVYANQGRHHFDTLEEAEKAKVAVEPGLKEKLGLEDIQVREVDCWDSGDAKATVF